MDAIDYINGVFLIWSVIVAGLNVRAIQRDKVVKGVSAIGVAFYVVSDFWYIYYYLSLGHYFSAICLTVATIICLVWATLWWRYRE